MNTYECLYGTDPLPHAERPNLLKDDSVTRVMRAYDENFDLSTIKLVASFEARNEAVFWQGQYGRLWARRVYVFGKRADKYSERPFLGFFHMRDAGVLKILRQNRRSRIPTVAECYLTLPKRLRDAGYRVLEGPFTTYYGVLPLNVTPMVIPHRLFAGYCAQSAAHTALMLMSPRGARPLGLFDLSLIFSNARELPNVQVKISHLTPSEIATLLCTKEAGIAAIEDVLGGPEDPYDWSPEDVFSVLRDCIYSGLPVIVAVDYTQWAQQAQRLQEFNSPVSSIKGKHAVVLVGYRAGEESGNPSVLFHCSNLGPWIRMDAKGLMEATSPHASLIEPRAICHMVVPVPKDVTLAPSAVTNAACLLLRGGSCDECRPSHFRRTLLSRDEFLGLYASRLRGLHPKSMRLANALASHYSEAELAHIWRVEHVRGQPITLFYGANKPSIFATIQDDRFDLYSRNHTRIHQWRILQTDLL
jgi:hypothetical protein